MWSWKRAVGFLFFQPWGYFRSKWKRTGLKNQSKGCEEAYGDRGWLWASEGRKEQKRVRYHCSQRAFELCSVLPWVHHGLSDPTGLKNSSSRGHHRMSERNAKETRESDWGKKQEQQVPWEFSPPHTLQIKVCQLQIRRHIPQKTVVLGNLPYSQLAVSLVRS